MSLSKTDTESTSIIVSYSSLENWKHRRSDKRTEDYWNKKAAKGPLNGWEEYQREWNFIEIEYSERPNNNGLGLGNPGFAFTTNLVKYIRQKKAEIKDGRIISTG